MKVIAKTRKVQGTSASRRLRRENKVPGILYGNNVAATPIEIDHKELFYDLQKEKFHASILTMELDGADQLLFRGQHVPVAGRFPVRDMVVVVVVLPALAAPTPGLALLFAQEEIRLIGNLPPRGRKGGFVTLAAYSA